MNKICFILPGWVTKQTGGAEWQTYLLSEEFVKLGWRVSVITSKPKSKLNHEYLNSGINYYYYKLLKIKSIQFIIALFYVLKSRSDIFYTRTDDKIFRAAIALVCAFSNKKMIYALAGDDELNYNKYEINNNLPGLLKVLRQIDFKIINRIIGKSENKADLIICQTNYQKQQLYKNKGLNSVVIHNSFLFNDNNNIENIKKDNIVLWIGNMREVKRPELFLTIAKELLNTDYKFIMIGGNTQYLDSYSISNNIEIIGSVSRNNVDSYLKKASFIINTSKTEGFSNVFLEAWYNKVWVITLGVDPDSIIENKGYGSVFNNAKSVSQFLRDSVYEKLDKKLINEAKEFVLAEFDLTINFNKLLKEIRSIDNRIN